MDNLYLLKDVYLYILCSNFNGMIRKKKEPRQHLNIQNIQSLGILFCKLEFTANKLDLFELQARHFKATILFPSNCRFDSHRYLPNLKFQKILQLNFNFQKLTYRNLNRSLVSQPSYCSNLHLEEACPIVNGQIRYSYGRLSSVILKLRVRSKVLDKFYTGMCPNYYLPFNKLQ